MIDLRYENAVIYCVDVDRFMDGNGDDRREPRPAQLPQPDDADDPRAPELPGVRRWGDLRLLDVGDGGPSGPAHRSDWRGGTVFAVHDLSPEPREAALALGDDGGRGDLNDVMSDREYERVSGGGPDARVPLAGHGFRRLRHDGEGG